MNGTEQRNHKTVTSQLADALETVTVTTANRLDRLDAAIGDGRRYVNNEDRHLRQTCQERWDATADTTKRITERHYAFVTRGFWSRLNWLVRGR